MDLVKGNERKEQEVSDSPAVTEQDHTAVSVTAWITQGAPTGSWTPNWVVTKSESSAKADAFLPSDENLLWGNV